jgi:hypothetical protein
MARISANVNGLSAFRYTPVPHLLALRERRKVVDVWREVCTLIYLDPKNKNRLAIVIF